MDRMKDERFDRIVIPEKLSHCVREGIREGEKIYMKNKWKKRMMRAGAAAAALLMCMGFFASQPALAAKIPVIRDIFKFLQEDYSYQGDLDSEAQKFEETEGAAEKEKSAGLKEDSAEGPAYTRTVNGVTVSISEAYCSVEAIYLSMRITSDERFPDTMTDMEGRPLISLKTSTEYSFDPVERSEETGYGGSGSLEGTFTDDHTYVGILRIDILDIAGNDDALKEKYRSLDSFDMNFTIEQIIGDKLQPEKLDLQGKTQEELEAMTDEEWKAFMNEITPADRNQYPNQYEHWWLNGPFTFDLTIKADKESAQIVTVDEMNDSGAGLYQVVKTKFEITVEEKCNEERTQKGVFIVVLDADGKLLPSGSSAYTDTYAINGREVSRVYVYVCDYAEYMDDIKGHRDDADFRQILEERALYGKEIVF